MTLDQAAIHEAGHAVADYVLGLRCESVELTHHEVEQVEDHGQVMSANPQYGYKHDSKKAMNDTMRDASIACCAGLAAEHVICGVPLEVDNLNARADFANIIDFELRGMPIPGKRRGCVGDEGTWNYIEKTLRKARTLVPQHQDLIRKLADVLVERKKLSGEEVKLLLDEWRRPAVTTEPEAKPAPKNGKG